MKLELIATLNAESAMRARFRSGQLPREWKAQCPQIFDDDDLCLALSQPNYHFHEWYAAKYLYEERGYFSLLEKYQFKNHKRKQTVLENLRSDQLQQALSYRDSTYKQQAPDLLAYLPDFSDWFFCEVKGGEDRFSQNQRGYFEKLAELSGKPIYWLKIHLL